MDKHRRKIKAWFESSGSESLGVGLSTYEVPSLAIKPDSVALAIGDRSIQISLSDGKYIIKYEGNDADFQKRMKDVSIWSNKASVGNIDVMDILNRITSTQADGNDTDIEIIEVTTINDKDDIDDKVGKADDSDEVVCVSSQLRSITEEEESTVTEKLSKKLKISNSSRRKGKVSTRSSTSNQAYTRHYWMIDEYLQVLRTQAENGITAEAVNDDVYNWRVKFYKFGNDNQISVDLKELDKKFWYNYIEIELEFSKMENPVVPPKLKMIRPRFLGFSLYKFLNLSFLNASTWTSSTSILPILKQIQQFIEDQRLRIDVNCDSNDRVKYPDGASSALELELIKLLEETDFQPRVEIQVNEANAVGTKSKHIPSSVADQSSSSNDAKRLKTSAAGNYVPSTATGYATPTTSTQSAAYYPNQPQSYWAKGTGYGSYSSTTWDTSKYVADQAQKDNKLEQILCKIAFELQMSRTFKSVGTRRNRTKKQIQSSDDWTDSHRNKLLLEESSLIPYLENFLRQHSMLEMDRHIGTYRGVFKILYEICEDPILQSLLLPLDANSKPFAFYLEPINEGLRIYSMKTNTVVQMNGKRSLAATSSSLDTMQPNEEDYQFMLQVCEAADKISSDASKTKQSTITRASLSVSSSSSSADYSNCTRISKMKISNLSDDESLRKRYVEAMIPLQYIEVDKFIGFHYQSFSNSSSKPRIRRLAQDHAEMSNPRSAIIDWSSSVWIRTTSERMDCLQVMISGPEGTPYENGLFIFDVYFPELYPSSPPQVNLRTTGRGSVRFNPNLYNCGKVCLSLLGTWSGNASERWSEKVSTFRQVLLSIQSLILVPEPYFNEPSYETMMNTPQGKLQSASYNSNIRLQTLQWAILDHLKNPATGFEEVITTHFRFKKAEILEQIDAAILLGDKSLKSLRNEFQTKTKHL